MSALRYVFVVVVRGDDGWVRLVTDEFVLDEFLTSFVIILTSWHDWRYDEELVERFHLLVGEETLGEIQLMWLEERTWLMMVSDVLLCWIVFCRLS